MGKAALGTSTLDSAAQAFTSDASMFLSDRSAGLAPGWVGEYKTVRADIRLLAVNCGVPRRRM
jgi:hypothetical protein